MKKKLFAFWRYDQFPYVLCGPIMDMRDDGCVTVDGYGKGYWFAPFKILPEESGRELRAKLTQLEDDYKIAMDKLHQENVAKLKKLLPEAIK